MRSLSRRELLGGTTALVAVSAGCLNDGGAIGDGGDADSPAAGGSDGGGASADSLSSIDASEGIEFAGFVQYSHPQPPDDADASLFTDADDARSWIESSPIQPESPAGTTLTETDYETERALVIEAFSPDGCHELAVDDVSLDDGTISVSAHVMKPDDAGDVCTQAITAVGCVVRVTTTGDPPNDASISVRLSDGSSVGMGMATDSASEVDEGSQRNASDEE
ncbi:hypothetical protein [Halovivax cerinus]|uniref:Uncharacterized protein n=1 Tax=Halovivax cerinus TaxID=1487865 RepID=A0ABD5NRA3_9EURY|nr:hypothetical protein [Halovivax cerinus]